MQSECRGQTVASQWHQYRYESKPLDWGLFQLYKKLWTVSLRLGNGVTKHQFTGGSMILGFDLTPDDGSEGVAYLTPRRFGTVKAHLHFKEGLTETVTLLAFATFDNTVSIDSNRAVSFDYTVWIRPNMLTGLDLEGLIRLDPVTSGRYLGGVSSYQRLPGLVDSTSGFYIVNTDRASGSREHWTCLWLNGHLWLLWQLQITTVGQSLFSVGGQLHCEIQSLALSGAIQFAVWSVCCVLCLPT